jgi:hypothetical protein
MESILEEIWRLEAMLHRIKGDSKKHQERKVIMAKLDNLSKKMKKS